MWLVNKLRLTADTNSVQLALTANVVNIVVMASILTVHRGIKVNVVKS